MDAHTQQHATTREAVYRELCGALCYAFEASVIVASQQGTEYI